MISKCYWTIMRRDKNATDGTLLTYITGIFSDYFELFCYLVLGYKYV